MGSQAHRLEMTHRNSNIFGRLLLSFVFVCCQWLWGTHCYAAEYLSHSIEHNRLIITSDEGRVTLTAKSQFAIEVNYQFDGQPVFPSFALADPNVVHQAEVRKEPGSLWFSVAGVQAEILLKPLNIRFFSADQLLIEEEIGLFQTQTIKGFRFTLQDKEKFYGGGQRVLGMDRRGHKMPLYNRAHYGYTTESNQMYYGLPGVFSNRHYALIFDNSAKGNLDIGHDQHDILQFDAVSGRTAYIVIGGKTYPEIIKNLTQVTGRQPLPPRWVLGNFASRFGYRTEQQTRDTVDKFKQYNIPLDAIVLDLYWFGKDIQGHMGNLDWDREAFPNAEKMISDFQRQGVKTVVITEPFILSTSDNFSIAAEAEALATNLAGDVKTFDFYFGNTALVDVFSQSGQHWFSQIYRTLSNQGVAGWWGDLGEPEVHPYDTLHQLGDRKVTADEIHNVYGHQWASILYHQQLSDRPERRPMILMRSGFIGSQRYGMIPWTGDVSRSWDGLKPQVELALQMSVFGMAYIHSDLGGFAGGESFDQELYIRWLQFGVFQPIYRPHGHESIAPEPVYHDPQTREIIAKYIRLRYQMLPYNYSLVYQNSLTGMPLMRPMSFENEFSEKAFDDASQYLWGEAFLVKPVTQPGVKSIEVSLPDGYWFDFWNKSLFAGNQLVRVNTDIGHLPVFVRAGQFVPSVAPVMSTDDYSSAVLNIDYYHHPEILKSEYILYDDDGNDPQAIANQHFQRILFSFNGEKNSKHLDLKVDGNYQNAPATRELHFTLYNWTRPVSQITLNDKKLSVSNDKSLTSASYYWDPNSHSLHLRITLSKSAKLRII